MQSNMSMVTIGQPSKFELILECLSVFDEGFVLYFLRVWLPGLLHVKRSQLKSERN